MATEIFNKDTYLEENAPDTAHGTDVYDIIEKQDTSPKGKGYCYILALVDFSDLTDLTDEDQVTSAYATLEENAGLNPNHLACTWYRCMRYDWVEAEATWNIYKTGSSWTTPGASGTGTDFDDTILSDTIYPYSPSTMTFVWTITNMIKDAITLRSKVWNAVMRCTGTVAEEDWAEFDCREATGSRPFITINYTVAGVARTQVLIF